MVAVYRRTQFDPAICLHISCFLHNFARVTAVNIRCKLNIEKETTVRTKELPKNQSLKITASVISGPLYANLR